MTTQTDNSQRAKLEKYVRDGGPQTEREQAIAKLREMLPPGSTAYTILRHVTRSGMMRHISVLVGTQDVTHLVARVIGVSRADDGGLRMSGAGMDMGFDVVYNLSSVLYRDGFTCTGESGHPNYCPSNDHSNGDRDYSPHMHSEGGYAIRQAWL